MPRIASLIPGADVSIDRLDMVVDGFIEPSMKLNASIGENKTERGVFIHDHFTVLPNTFKVTGIVDSIRSPSDVAVDAWKEVMNLHKQGSIVKFITEFWVMDECVIKSASTTIKTRGLEFMLELQQILRVGITSTSDELAPAVNNPNNPAAQRQPQVDTGTKNPVQLQRIGRVFSDGTFLVEQADEQGNTRKVLPRPQ